MAMLAFGEAVVSSGRGCAAPIPTPPTSGRAARRADALPKDARRTDPRDATADAVAPTVGTDALLRAAVEEAARLLDADGAMVYLVDQETGNLRFAHDAGHQEPPQSRVGPRRRPRHPGPGCSAGRSPSVPWSSPTTTPTTPRSRTPRPRTGSSPTSASARWSWRPLRARRRGLWRARHVQPAAGGLRSGADRPRPLARRPRRRGDRQHAPDRRPRPVPRPAGRAGRGRAQPARDQRPHLGRLGPVRRPAACRRRGGPAARAPTAPASISSTRDPACSRWAYASGALKPDDIGLAGRSGRDAGPGRVRSGGRHRSARSGPATTSTTIGSRTGWAPTRYVDSAGIRVGHGRAAHRRGRRVRRPDDLHQRAATPGTSRTPTCSARSPPRRPSPSPVPGSSTSSTGRARASPVGPRRSRPCARSPPGSRPCATRPTSSRRSSSWPVGWSAARAPSSTCSTRGPATCAGRSTTGCRGCSPTRSGASCGSRSGRARPGSPSPRTASSSPATTWPACSRRRRSRPSSTSGPGFHSMIAAPITGDDGPLGVIEVYAIERDAFEASDADLVRALASQAAIAITNARLIRELAESRSDLARTADAERTLREIAARVSAMRDEREILQAVAEAAQRLLRADGAMLDLIGLPELSGAWSHKDDQAGPRRPHPARGHRGRDGRRGVRSGHRQPGRRDDRRLPRRRALRPHRGARRLRP